MGANAAAPIKPAADAIGPQLTYLTQWLLGIQGFAFGR